MCYLAMIVYVGILATLSYFTSPWVMCILLFTGFSCNSEKNEKPTILKDN